MLQKRRQPGGWLWEQLDNVEHPCRLPLCLSHAWSAEQEIQNTVHAHLGVCVCCLCPERCSMHHVHLDLTCWCSRHPGQHCLR